MSTSPTSTQLKQLQKGAMRTRLDSSPRKKTDQGYGYGRICAEDSCPTTLNHLHFGPFCHCCEDRRHREGLEA
jgi:hypothetical protein